MLGGRVLPAAVRLPVKAVEDGTLAAFKLNIFTSKVPEVIFKISSSGPCCLWTFHVPESFLVLTSYSLTPKTASHENTILLLISFPFLYNCSNILRLVGVAGISFKLLKSLTVKATPD